MKCLASAFVLALVAGVALATVDVEAQGPNRAGIVVSFDNTVRTACIDFDEAEISGAELLRRASFDVVAAGGGMGSAVCMIDGVGCADPNDCWCQCHGSTCRYWAYFTLEEGNWKYSPIGASQRKVHDGDVDGWTWGVGSASSAPPPGPVSFEEVCPPEEPPPTSTPQPKEPTIAYAAPIEAPVEAAAATPEPEATSGAVTQTPLPLATRAMMTSTPKRLIAEASEAPDEGDGSSFPWQLPVFGALAVVLLGSAVVVARRRQRG
jgi:hypothetical protein